MTTRARERSRARLRATVLAAPFREVLAHWSRDRATLRQGFTALGISTVVGMAAGVVLGQMENLLDTYRGLLLLVPAAIGMRGAIFGALGARLGTGILTGQLTSDRSAGSFLRANVAASASLTFASSALAAVAARGVGALFGIETIGVWQLLTVSMLGGLLASVFILLGVIGLALTAQRRGWDMDAIGSPLITATGDIVTLPALVLATFVLPFEGVSTGVGVAGLVVALAATARGVLQRPGVTRRIVRESIPVLTYAAVVDILAGGVLEARLEDAFLGNAALLILIPPFIANCGSLGGILSARLGSELHLGMITPRAIPDKLARLEGSTTALFGVAAFTGVGLIAHVAAVATGLDSPGLGSTVGISLVGGFLALFLLYATAYAAATATFRFGLDPDNHGIPIVTATMDLLGVLCLVGAIALFGAT